MSDLRLGLERAREAWGQIKQWLGPACNESLAPAIDILDTELAALPAPDASPSAEAQHLDEIHVNLPPISRREGMWIPMERFRALEAYERGEQPQVRAVWDAVLKLHDERWWDSPPNFRESLVELRDQKGAASEPMC